MSSLHIWSGNSWDSILSFQGLQESIPPAYVALIYCSRIPELFNIQKLRKEPNKNKVWGRGRCYTFERETAETVFLNFQGAHQESIPLAYVDWWAGATTLLLHGS